MKCKITYRGWGGHFCGAQHCLFRLNTLIEYNDIKIVVSTVGNYHYKKNNDEDKILEIGYNRYFETMAFYAKKEHEYWEGNVKEIYNFDSEWSWGKDGESQANTGHIKVVEEIRCKLEGKKFIKNEIKSNLINI